MSRVWAELEAEPGDRGLATKRVHPGSQSDLHVGLDLDSRRRQLIFERPWRPADTLPVFPATQAITCRSRLQPGGRRMTITIELLDTSLSDVFTPLVEDLAERAAQATDHNAATAELASGLARWQHLLEQMGRDGLSTLERRGLAGELMVLVADILPHATPEAAISSWTGPLKANQDFQRPAIAIEVKVTTGQNPQGFIVANERELDVTGSGTLAVAHISLDERIGGNGSSLSQLVAAVRDRLAGHPFALDEFGARLARAGYWDSHQGLYHEPRYQVRASHFFQVRDDFPRIVEGDLRDGVGAVRYTVSISACAGFELDAADLHRLVSMEVL
jgi:Putative  PD-(D/E)XK family member, (DUF4420)